MTTAIYRFPDPQPEETLFMENLHARRFVDNRLKFDTDLSDEERAELKVIQSFLHEDRKALIEEREHRKYLRSQAK